MQWIRCDYASNEVLGLRYVRRLEIKAGPEARTLRLSNKSGTWQHTTTYHEMPCTGWVIVA